MTSGAVSAVGASETSSGASGSAGAGATSGCAPTVVSLRGTPVHVLFDVSSSMGSLDADELTLSYENASGARITLEYDQSCDTEDAWRFDDASELRSLVPCGGICQTVQDEAGAGELTVDPSCE